MSLRFTSVTHRSPAARRPNALKSTGPRTRHGKARVCLKAQRCSGGVLTAGAVVTARSARLREKLLEAGQTRQEALCGAVRARVAKTIPVQDPASRRESDQIALCARCLERTLQEQSWKPLCFLEVTDSGCQPNADLLAADTTWWPLDSRGNFELRTPN